MVEYITATNAATVDGTLHLCRLQESIWGRLGFIVTWHFPLMKRVLEGRVESGG